MKEIKNNLVSALTSRRKNSEDVPNPLASLPRSLELKGEEVGSARDYFPGDNIGLSVEGHVHSIHQDGRVVVHLHRVDVKKEAPRKEEMTLPVEEVPVRTQQSHA